MEASSPLGLGGGLEPVEVGGGGVRRVHGQGGGWYLCLRAQEPRVNTGDATTDSGMRPSQASFMATQSEQNCGSPGSYDPEHEVNGVFHFLRPL